MDTTPPSWVEKVKLVKKDILQGCVDTIERGDGRCYEGHFSQGGARNGGNDSDGVETDWMEELRCSATRSRSESAC